MPRISLFYGIVIAMYFDDHPPPHFHARYAEHEAQVAIATGGILQGTLPRRAHALVREWVECTEASSRRIGNLPCVNNRWLTLTRCHERAI